MCSMHAHTINIHKTHPLAHSYAVYVCIEMALLSQLQITNAGISHTVNMMREFGCACPNVTEFYYSGHVIIMNILGTRPGDDYLCVSQRACVRFPHVYLDGARSKHNKCEQAGRILLAYFTSQMGIEAHT